MTFTKSTCYLNLVPIIECCLTILRPLRPPAPLFATSYLPADPNLDQETERFKEPQSFPTFTFIYKDPIYFKLINGKGRWENVLPLNIVIENNYLHLLSVNENPGSTRFPLKAHFFSINNSRSLLMFPSVVIINLVGNVSFNCNLVQSYLMSSKNCTHFSHSFPKVKAVECILYWVKLLNPGSLSRLLTIRIKYK